MRIANWLGILVAAALAAAFAISNREVVSLAFWPSPFVAALPLYLLAFAAFVVGFVAGAIAVWIGGRHRRRQLRASQRRIGALERELATARARLGDPEPPMHPPR